MVGRRQPDRGGPRVVIAGAGLGGVAAARRLARAPVEVTVVDRENYQTFSPLLYEVANCILDAEQVGHSVRALLRRCPNAHFRLGEATGTDWESKELLLASGERLRFDYLVLATGLPPTFHGIDGASEYAFPLKTMEDALRLRHRTLLRLEQAAARPSLVGEGHLDIVLVGGGPTGVELAGALAEVYLHAFKRDYPEIDIDRARIVLLEMSDGLLPAFHPRLRQYAQDFLEAHRVEVRLRSRIERVTPNSVIVADGEELRAGTIIWAAGLGPGQVSARLGLPHGPDGRVPVKRDLRLQGRDDTFVIGDLASLPRRHGGLHPQLAQFALQGGRHAARQIQRLLQGQPTRPFRYLDKGMVASIGRPAGVVQAGPLRLTGRLGFLTLSELHLLYLEGQRNRASVAVNWLWSGATRGRGASLLIEPPADGTREAAGVSNPVALSHDW
jgi:NADH:quinone reductase (non-electrogenic)